MTQATPIIRSDTLVYQQEGQEHTLVVGTSAWYAWLRTATTFVFTCGSGTFTARKERAGNKRGGWYWRAYRQRDSKLRRVYVGKSEELTLQRLNIVAAILAERDDITVDEREHVQHVQQGQPGSTRDQERFLQSPTGASWDLAEAGAASHSAARRSSNLPAPLTSLIGREREVAAACTLLQRAEVRLLTLTGTGGVGKTRLALQIASEVQDDFTDGICFVSLAPVHDAALVLPTMARALGLQGNGAQPPLEQLKAFLQDKHLLLVLDNFEHLIAAATLLVALLLACPRLTLLITSREVLHVRGERAFAVQPLALPDPLHLPAAETISHYGAVALFLERAREIHPTFELTTGTAPLIVEICRRVDGLPLTIELAAARLRLLPLPILLERLEHRLAVLTGGPRDLPERQQTLRNTIAWSYELLSGEEQRLFRLLSVFVGGCTLETVEAVYRTLGGESAQVLDTVTSLLDKHLLYQEKQESNEPRLLMLETIREYGWECLSTCSELEQTRRAYAVYYLHLAKEAEAHLYDSEQVWWFDRLEREHSNLRAVLRWSVEQGESGESVETALRLAGILHRFWAVRGYVGEGRHWLDRALASSEGGTTPVRAKALSGAAWLALRQSDYERAEALSEESLALSRELRDTQGIARELNRLGLIASARGNHARARSLLEESLALSREVGDTGFLAYMLMALGAVIAAQGEPMRARAQLEESLALSRKLGNKEGIAWALYYLGGALFAQGDVVSAYALGEESLALCRAINHRGCLARTLDLLGRCALQWGQASRAQPLFEESLALFRAVGEQRNTAWALSRLARVATVQGDNGAAQALYEESWAIFRESGDTRGQASCLQGLAGVVARQGEVVRAARLWGAAQSLHETSSPHDPFILPGERADDEQSVAAARAQLGEQTFAAAWAEGRMMTPEQAIAAQGQPLVSNQPPAKPNTKPRTNAQKRLSPTSPNGLTEREVEVLRLLARGLTDAQIAEALVISPRTVNAHLRSIYAKLNVTSRNAAAHYAFKQKLV